MLKPVQASTYTLRDILRGGFLLDKTHDLYKLVRFEQGVYFLSRPRRFGKSLTVSMLEEIFRGNKELFQGLWIYEKVSEWKEHLDTALKV